MDDNELPYKMMTYREIKENHYDTSVHINNVYVPTLNGKNREREGEENRYTIANMIVPLNYRMNMMAVDARDIFINLLSGPFGFTNMLKRGDYRGLPIETLYENDVVPGAKKEHPLIVRIFMTPSRRLKTRRAAGLAENYNYEAAQLYAGIPMPRFVWVCEIYTKDSYMNNQVVGEIVMDATSSRQDEARSIILFHYPFFLVYRNPSEPWNEYFWKKKFLNTGRLSTWTPFPKMWFGHTVGYDESL